MLARLSVFFLPHSSNNHRARVLHHSSLFFYILLFLLFQAGISFMATSFPDVLGYAANISPDRVVEVTNAKRSEAGLSPLSLNSSLSEAAQRKAGDMFAFNYWAHFSPSGRSPWDFFREVGYRYLFAGENLARDFQDSESVVNAWMNSPTHKDNLLNPNYREIGVAVVNGTLAGSETTLVVQMFGTQAGSSAALSKKGNSASPKAVVEEKLPTPVVSDQAVQSQAEQISPAILARATGQETRDLPFWTPYFLTRVVGIFLLGFLLGMLLLDGIIVYRRGTLRLTGRNFAHASFLILALILVWFSHQGVIL